jgi:hypothetical protein
MCYWPLHRRGHRHAADVVSQIALAVPLYICTKPYRGFADFEKEKGDCQVFQPPLK